MADDFNIKIQLALWGAAAGGVASLIINLFFNVFIPRISRWNLTRCIKAYPEAPHGIHARCRIYNSGYWTIGQAMAYLSL